MLTNGPAGSVHFSDLVQTSNNRAIAIGSHRSVISGASLSLSDDTTIVDFLQVNSLVDPPSVSHLNHYEISEGPSSPSKISGHAHDVAITPNGAIAVVSHRNHVHFFTMRGGQIGSDNIGEDSISFNGANFTACSPDLAVDSVEVTDTRAVVITTKYPQSGAQSIMMAYVYDLTTNPVQRLAGFHIWDLDPTTAPPGNFQVVAHDLAITPDGSKAVVTGNFVAALVNLTSTPPALIGKIKPEPNELRGYRFNVDSVELTNDRAVVLCTKANPLLGTLRWSISLFNLNPPSSIPMVVYDDQTVFPAGENDAHDLAITIAPQMGTVALVRTANEMVSFSVTSPPVAPTIISLANRSPLNAWLSPKSIVSDSVVATNSVAITIGTASFIGSSQGVVDFLDLTGGSTQLTATSPILAANNFIRACDLRLIPGGGKVVVRCADGLPMTVPPTQGLDLQFFDIQTNIGAPLAHFGATGNAWGVDSLEMGTSSLISISQVLTNPPFNGTGHVQVISLQ